MPDEGILRALAEAWLRDGGRGKRLLDLSCGAGTTARMLAAHGALVVATDYVPAGCSGDNIRYVGGVDLNDPLPFKSACFDGINLTEVIEHIEHQAQLIREMSRVVRGRGCRRDQHSQCAERTITIAFSVYRFSARTRETSSL